MKYRFISLIIISISAMVLGMANKNSEKDRFLYSWEFDDPDFELSFVNGCEANVEDGKLKINVTGKGENMFVFPNIDIPGPLKVQIRMRSGNGLFGEAELYWKSREGQEWDESRLNKYPLKHDMSWHIYEIPLSLYGRLRELRLDTGWKKGEAEIDWIRFAADPIPAEKITANRNLPQDDIVLADETLEFRVNAAKAVMSVKDKRNSRLWHSSFDPDSDYIVKAEKIASNTARIGFWDNSAGVDYTGTVTLEPGGVLSFELDADVYHQAFHACSTFPPKFVSDFEDGKLIFCNRSSGMYLDQKDDFKDFQKMLVYGNLSLDMPWIGVVDENTGDGLMVLVESPCDSWIYLRKDARGNNWPQIFWWPSMDTFRYPRKMSYRFSDGGGYVRLARMYRDIADKTGKLKTLSQKQAERPDVELLKGAPYLWGATDTERFIKEARTFGLRRGVIGNAHHGLQNTSSLRRINKLGFITNEYGNVSDILPGPASQLTDDIEKASYHARPGLGPKTGWLASDGTQYYSRSSATAMAAATAYLPGRLKEFGFNGGFIDVSMAIDLFEDYHPDHTFDRRQDMKNRREFFKYYLDQGLVMGTEHGNDWGIDLVDYTEGAAGGPLWWKGGWSAGELRRPESLDEINPDYIKYGMGCDVSIPLWQLVYHDCSVSTWYWGDSAGFMYNVSPELAARKDLFNLLYGTAPLMWRDDVGYDWSRNRSRFMKTYYETCMFNEQTMFDQLTNHQFLSEDKSLQKTEFSSGAFVVVNFGEESALYADNGKNIEIAPSGFYVKGKNIYQVREVIDGNTVTFISAADFMRAETPVQLDVGPFRIKGSVTMFEYEKGRWNVILENARDCRIDISNINGFEDARTLRVFTMDKYGRLLEEKPCEIDGKGFLTLSEVSGEAVGYAVMTDMPSGYPVILPQIEEVPSGTMVSVSTAENNQIRYTTDGSIPGETSALYDGPFAVNFPVKVKAIADGAGEFTYRPVNIEFKSGVMTGGGSMMDFNVDVSGAKTLIIEVEQCGTAIWQDYADWLDPVLADTQGRKVNLSDMKPSQVLHDQLMVGWDCKVRNDEKKRHPLTVGGKVYQKGIGMISPSRIEFDLLGKYKTFSGKVGIDDTAGTGGKLEFIIMTVN
jgi:hypothetical protein